MIKVILDFLDLKETLKMQLVCKRYYNIIVPEFLQDRTIPLKYAKIDNFLASYPEMPPLVKEEQAIITFKTQAKVWNKLKRLTAHKIISNSLQKIEQDLE